LLPKVTAKNTCSCDKDKKSKSKIFSSFEQERFWKLQCDQNKNTRYVRGVFLVLATCVEFLRFSQRIAESLVEMASSHNIGSSLSTLVEWYKIRDTFFGQNYVSQDIPLALELAARCSHPDALWLTEACAGKGVTRKEEARLVFSALGQNDARALCFMWLCVDEDEDDGDLAALRRSAELGFAFAQAWMAGATGGEEKIKFAQMATSQGEREGFSSLGRCFRYGHGCEEDFDKAKENFLLASKLGFVLAMIELGWLLEESDPRRWQWWGRAAALGASWNILSSFSEQVALFNSGSGSGAVMFAIGQALKGHVNEQKRTIFNSNIKFDSRIGPAKQAISSYEAQTKATKDAMRAWTLVGIKLKVVKDVRKLIAKLIWDSREEALYTT
jgi:hypothetical protein